MSDMDEYHRKRAQMRHEEDRNAKKILLKGMLGGTSTAFVSSGKYPSSLCAIFTLKKQNNFQKRETNPLYYLLMAVLNHTDVVKVRLQIQSASAAKQATSTPLVPYYKNFGHTYSRIASEEGFRVLVGRGMFASVVRELTYSSIRMGLYDPCKAFFSNGNASHDTSFLTKFMAGATSGAIGAFIASPCDLVKIRQQGIMPYEKMPYRNFFHALAVINKEEGFRALYRGASTTVIRGVVITASQLSSYDQAKYWLVNELKHKDDYRTHFMYVACFAFFFALSCFSFS